MRKLADAYYKLLNVLLVAAVVALLIPVTLQMISRQTGLIPAWIWTEEMARFFFIWLVMIGAMIGVREGTHFEVDVWPRMGARGNAALGLVSMIFVLITALIFLWYGIKFVQFGWNQTSELADLPMAWIFAAWPLAGITWLIFGLPRLRADIRILIYGPTPHDVAVARDVGTGSLI